jgi:hypothetical protein
MVGGKQKLKVDKIVFRKVYSPMNQPCRKNLLGVN